MFNFAPVFTTFSVLFEKSVAEKNKRCFRYLQNPPLFSFTSPSIARSLNSKIFCISFCSGGQAIRSPTYYFKWQCSQEYSHSFFFADIFYLLQKLTFHFHIVTKMLSCSRDYISGASALVCVQTRHIVTCGI